MVNPYSIPPLLTLCCFLGLAVLSILRSRRTTLSLLFFLICVLGVFLYTDIFLVFNVNSASTALMISRIDHFFIIYLFPLYIHFFHEYLRITGRKWLVRMAYIYAFLLMWFTPTSLYIESMQKHYFGFYAKGGKLFSLFGIAGLLVTIYVLVIIYQSIRKEHSSIHKNRLKYVLAGFGVMGFMNGLNVLPSFGYAVYPPGNLSFIPFVVFAVGIFKYDLLDTGLLIKKSLFYSILTALLTCLYAMIVIVADRLFEDFDFSGSIYFPVVFFSLVTFVFGPLKKRVQIFVDRIFYKGKYDYQKTLKHVSQTIVSLLSLDEIGKLLVDTLVDNIAVNSCAFFIWDETTSCFINFAARGKRNFPQKSTISTRECAFVGFMRKRSQPVMKTTLLENDEDIEAKTAIAELNALYAEIVLPVTSKGSLLGFITVGEKRSGDLFSPEDLDLFETLAGQTALAVENARSYKHIEDLNKNLEKRVAERTRVLEKTIAEKEQTQELLIRSESLAALGQLVAGVAHELNNPLASAASLIQTATEELTLWDTHTPPDEDLVDDLKFATRELARAKSIVASLLGLSRQTQTYSESVDFNRVVQDALRVLHNQIKHNTTEIVEKYESNLPIVQGNFANLGQVALNIIQNALQAISDRKGTIFLSTRFDNVSAEVVFSCQDTGPGVEASIRRDVFKPFFTTKEVGSGTGLGLYICHEIIHRHNGTINFENVEGYGVRFEVRLPADISGESA